MGTATIGVYADAAGTITTWDAPLFTQVHYYVVAHGVTADIDRYFFNLDVPTGLSPVTLQDFDWPAGASGSTIPGTTEDHFLVGFKDDCLSPVDGTLLLGHFALWYLQPMPDLAVTIASPDLGPASCMAPSEFPSYGTCDSGCEWTYFAPDLQTACGGQVFADYDADCQKDPGELGLAGRTVILDPGDRAATTDANGWYSFVLPDPGEYTVRLDPFPNWTTVCPVNGEHVFVAGVSGVVSGLDVASDPDLTVHDVAISIAAGRARLGRGISYTVSIRNLGFQPEDPCTATFSPPAELVFVECSDGGVYDGIGHTVTWTVALAPGVEMNPTVRLTVPPELELGTLLASQGGIQSPSVDDHPENNVCQDSTFITGPFDPNEKRVVPAEGLVPEGLLSYQIHFQNVGNDTAFTVVIRDTLEMNLDMATVTAGAASDPYVLTKTNRELRWTFANIDLPDSTADEEGSHGYVAFTVRPVAGLANSTVLANRAAIFFDYNDPVITNVATTTFLADPSGVGDPVPAREGTIRLDSMPNPFNPMTTIAFSLPASAHASLRIYDIAGRLVRSLLDEVRPSGVTEVDWNGADDAGQGVASGTYFVRLSVDGRHSTRALALVR